MTPLTIAAPLASSTVPLSWAKLAPPCEYAGVAQPIMSAMVIAESRLDRPFIIFSLQCFIRGLQKKLFRNLKNMAQRTIYDMKERIIKDSRNKLAEYEDGL